MYAASVVDMRIQLRKPDMSDVIAKTDSEEKLVARERHVQEFSKRSLASLRDAMEDLITEQGALTEPTQAVESDAVVDNTHDRASNKKHKKVKKSEDKEGRVKRVLGIRNKS